MAVILALQFHSYNQLFAIAPVHDNYLKLLFSITETAGLIGFIANKKLLTPLFWKSSLWVCVAWDIYSALTAFDWYKGWNPKILIMVPALLSPLILFLPMYRALYLYSYKSAAIWKTQRDDLE
ncbi:MAG: hypothetical protein FIA97_00295 [Methylococcaceae bacterium]|nr:hypothetical protein [Methylococcaceae bacterium]